MFFHNFPPINIENHFMLNLKKVSIQILSSASSDWISVQIIYFASISITAGYGITGMAKRPR